MIPYYQAIEKITSILKRYKSQQEPAELINEAYLRLSDTNAEITGDSLFITGKRIYLDTFNENKIRGRSKKTTKICPMCKEDLPMACYGIRYDTMGNSIPKVYCFECYCKYQKAWREKKKSSKNLDDNYIKSLLNKAGTGIPVKLITKDKILQKRSETKELRFKRRLAKSNVENLRMKKKVPDTKKPVRKTYKYLDNSKMVGYFLMR